MDINEEIVVLIIPLIVYIIYILCTHFTKKVTIVSKHQRVIKGYNMFMVVDRYGNHYNVEKSYLFLSFCPDENWEDMKLNRTYYVSGYGIRCGLLDMYPMIYSVSGCIRQE